jgi:hypothetical protein
MCVLCKLTSGGNIGFEEYMRQGINLIMFVLWKLHGQTPLWVLEGVIITDY